MLLGLVLLAASALAQDKWCGKHYKQGQPVIHPGGRYPVPQHSDSPLLLFRCYTAISPYIHGEDDTAAIIIDLEVTHVAKKSTFPLHDDPTSFKVQIGNEEHGSLVNATLQLGLKQEVVLPLKHFEPSQQPYALQCSIHSTEVPVSTELFYLPPNPYDGSVVKTDYKRSALLVRSHDEWKPFIGFGFYTAFDNYLAKNLSILDDFVDRGYNLVHPVPTFGNVTALNLVLDRMEELGLWLVYDMRWSYKNLTQIAEEVDAIKKRKNLLAWYTADEPDGWTDDTALPQRASELISQLDGYHPTSLVLNCRDYNFAPYTSNTPLLLHDTYPIGTNTTWSTVYSTECTPTFGDCGCDECESSEVGEVAIVLEEYARRLEWMGERKVLWSVVQAFGEQSFWSRYPTGREFALMSILALSSGATGITPWIAPTTPEIDDAATKLAKMVPRLAEYMLHPSVKVDRPVVRTLGGHICPFNQEQLYGRALTDGQQLPLMSIPDDEDLSSVMEPTRNHEQIVAVTYTAESGILLIFANLDTAPRNVSIRFGPLPFMVSTTQALFNTGANMLVLTATEDRLHLHVELNGLASGVYVLQM